MVSLHDVIIDNTRLQESRDLKLLVDCEMRAIRFRLGLYGKFRRHVR